MKGKLEHCVQVIYTRTSKQPDEALGMVLDWLRYAGVVGEVESIGEGFMWRFVIRPPRGVESCVWATRNAERINSFGAMRAAVVARTTV